MDILHLQRPRTTEPVAATRTFAGRRLARDDNDGHDADVSSPSSQSSATMSASQPSPLLPQTPNLESVPQRTTESQPQQQRKFQPKPQAQPQRQVYRPPHQRGLALGVGSFPLTRAPGHLPPPPTPNGVEARHRPPALTLNNSRGSSTAYADLNGPVTAPVSRIAGAAALRGISIDTAIRRARERERERDRDHHNTLDRLSSRRPTPITPGTATPGLSRRRGITMAVLVQDALVAESEPVTPFLPPAPRSAAPILSSQEATTPVAADPCKGDTGSLLAPPAAERKELILCRYYHTPGMVCTSSPCRFVHNLPALHRASGTAAPVPSPATATFQLQIGPGTASITPGVGSGQPSASLSITPRASSPAFEPRTPGRQDPTKGTFAAAQTAAPVPIPASLQLDDVDVALLTSGEAIAVRDGRGMEAVGHVFKMSGGGKGPAGKSRLKFKTVPCRDFAAGKCAYGVYCSFIHDPNNLYDEEKHGKKPKSEASDANSSNEKSEAGSQSSTSTDASQTKQTAQVEKDKHEAKVEEQKRIDTEASSEEPAPARTLKLKKSQSIDNIAAHKIAVGPAGLDDTLESPPLPSLTPSLNPPRPCFVSGPERPKSTPAHMPPTSHPVSPPITHGQQDIAHDASDSDSAELWDPAKNHISDPPNDGNLAAPVSTPFSPIPAAHFITMPAASPPVAQPMSRALSLSPRHTQHALLRASPTRGNPLLPSHSLPQRPIASPTYSSKQSALTVSMLALPPGLPDPPSTTSLPSPPTKSNPWVPPTSLVEGSDWPDLSTVRPSDSPTTPSKDLPAASGKGKGPSGTTEAAAAGKKGRARPITPVAPPKKPAAAKAATPKVAPKAAPKGKMAPNGARTQPRAPAQAAVPAPPKGPAEVEWPALESKGSPVSPKTSTTAALPTQSAWKVPMSVPQSPTESKDAPPTMTRTSTTSTAPDPVTPALGQAPIQATEATPTPPSSSPAKALPRGYIWKSDTILTPKGSVIRNRPQASYHTKLCKYFAMGNCVYADECSFLHPAPGQEIPAPASAPARPLPMPHKNIICAAYNEPHGCALTEEECDFAHLTIVPDDPARPRKRAVATRICRHFQVGRCLMGNDCFFLHVLPAVNGSGMATPTPSAVPSAPWISSGSSLSSSLTTTGTTNTTEWQAQSFHSAPSLSSSEKDPGTGTDCTSPTTSSAPVIPPRFVSAAAAAATFSPPTRPPFTAMPRMSPANGKQFHPPPRVPRNTPQPQSIASDTAEMGTGSTSARSSFSFVSPSLSPHLLHMDVPLSTPVSPKLLTPAMNVHVNGNGKRNVNGNGNRDAAANEAFRDGYFADLPSPSSSPAESMGGPGGATGAEHCPDWAQTGQCSNQWCHLSHVGEGEGNAAALTEAALAAACEQLRKVRPMGYPASDDEDEDDDDELEITTAATTATTATTTSRRAHSSQSSSFSSAIRIVNTPVNGAGVTTSATTEPDGRGTGLDLGLVTM